MTPCGGHLSLPDPDAAPAVHRVIPTAPRVERRDRHPDRHGVPWAAKSWITAAYVLWQVPIPQLKIGVFGSARRAVNFVNFCMALIHEMPILKHLQPRTDQRQSSTAFDVSPARPDQTPSVFALGITASVVGYRADIIVGDDVETNKNP